VRRRMPRGPGILAAARSPFVAPRGRFDSPDGSRQVASSPQDQC
jgi:hypothetical protein